MTTFEEPSPLEKSIAAVPFDLPDGVVIRPRHCREFRYWISDELPTPGTWSLLRAYHPESGLWPVFLHGHEDEPNRPWVYGDVGQPLLRPPDEFSAAAVLELLWNEHTEPLSGTSAEERLQDAAVIAPFGLSWPGLAPAIEPATAPDRVADDIAERLVKPAQTRLGLVPVSRSADVLGYTGWPGPTNATLMEPGALSAVLRDWEVRFGARLIRIGCNSLVLSVAAPPATRPTALQVAAEHFAFCRDNFSFASGALASYAEELIGVPHWSFWWDEDLSWS
jgi:hypothetical protein